MRGTNATGLKLTAVSNQELDRLFDSATGGCGGAAVASVKEITAALWPIAATASVPDPRIDEHLAKASACRDAADVVRHAIDAVKAAESAESHLRSSQEGGGPVRHVQLMRS